MAGLGKKFDFARQYTSDAIAEAAN
jgi:hypothetical protein